MKSKVMFAAVLAVTTSANAQWIRYETPKDAVTETSRVIYYTHSAQPEKSILMASCYGKELRVSLIAGFQVRRTSGVDSVQVPARFDSTVHPVWGSLTGDRNDGILFQPTDNLWFLESKRMVLQVREYGSGDHDLIFTVEPLDLKCDAKEGN
jgi:hypothetical protein